MACTGHLAFAVSSQHPHQCPLEGALLREWMTRGVTGAMADIFDKNRSTTACSSLKTIDDWRTFALPRHSGSNLLTCEELSGGWLHRMNAELIHMAASHARILRSRLHAEPLSNQRLQTRQSHTERCEGRAQARPGC